jgi:type VI secretion system protein ImpJ
MAAIDKIVWSEGMFLQPQHFQQQDRYIANLLVERLNTVGAYHWGITELKIDEQLLLLGKFAIKTCSGILPDGTSFNIPARDKAPPPIEIPIGTTHSIIYLSLPCWRAGVPETYPGKIATEQIYRFQAETIEVADSNAGADNVTPLQIGKLVLSLKLQQEDRQGFSCLGLCRVLEARADHQVILDDQYLPPCLNIYAIRNFSSFIQEIQGLLHYRGNMITQRLQASAGGIAETADFMLLQVINRFEPLFNHFAELKSLHPENLYRVLIQLAGELSTFTSRQRRPIALSIYWHVEQQNTFNPVMIELRRSLSVVFEENAIALKLEQQQRGTWVAALHDKSLIEKAIFVIAVHAAIPQENIRILFPAQAKVGPVEEIRNLVNRALPGIDMSPLPVAPRQIPYHTDSVYFALNHHHPLWQQLLKSAGMAFHIGNVFPELRLELWAIKDKRHE